MVTNGSEAPAKPKIVREPIACAHCGLVTAYHSHSRHLRTIHDIHTARSKIARQRRRAAVVQEPDDDGDVSIRAVSATASHGGVEDILQTFDEHEMSRDADLKAALHAHPFQTLDGLSSSHRALWEEESGVGLPRLLDSAACWAQEPLTLEELYRIGWRNTTTGKSHTFVAGRQSDALGYLSWCQLQRPDRIRPAYTITDDIAFPDGYRMCVPPEIDFAPLPDTPVTQGVNITPEFTMVDLHIDHGRAGLLCCLEDCQKLVLLWPPTRHNMQLLFDLRECDVLLMEGFARRLEGGVVVDLDRRRGLVIPGGTLHATLTLKGGWLAGMNWFAGVGHRAAARSMWYEIKVATGRPELIKVLAMYRQSLTLACSLDRPADYLQMLEGWKEWVAAALAEPSARRSPWDVTVYKTLHAIRLMLEQACDKTEGSICCDMATYSFAHFASAHIPPYHYSIKQKGLLKPPKHTSPLA